MKRFRGRKKKPQMPHQKSLFEKAGEIYRTLKGVRLFRILGIIAVILLLATVAIHFVEYRSGHSLGIWDSFWWALVTITTVGYGDIVPSTVFGRLIGFGIMFAGLILVSLMTATIASVFVTRKIKEGKGLENIKEKDHVVVCGWNENGLSVIQGLSQQLKSNMPVIVLVNDLPREEVDSIIYHFPKIEFKYVRGNFTKEEILARANIFRARSAIILADTASGYPADKADERTIFGCMAIKSLAPKVKTCAELISNENREHLSRAKVDEIFVRGEYAAAVLSSAAATVGLSTVIKGLFDLEESNKLWRAEIPERFFGQTVAELSEYYMEKFEGLLVAIVTETKPIQLDDILSHDATAIDEFIKRKFEESGREYFSSKEQVAVQINPARNYVVTKDDAAIILGRKRPGPVSFLEKSLDLVVGGRRAED